VEFGCFDTEALAVARTRLLGAAETGLFRFETTFPVTALGADGKADTVATWLEVDSPIDVTEIAWVQRPVLYYVGNGPGCDPNKAILSPPVDIDIHPSGTHRRRSRRGSRAWVGR